MQYDNIVVVKNLYKSYKEHVLFENFNLEIKQGDFVIFSGKSGCGKTTLLNMIGGLENFDEGTISVAGRDIRKKRIQYFRDVVGFVFQNFVLIEDKTVQQNLNLIRSHNRSGISIKKALRLVGLEGKQNQKVYTLSGGEQQRVALARLLIKKCLLILADEPTGSLDRENAKIVMNILKLLNHYGKTILMVTHDESLKGEGNRVVNLI